MIELLNNFKGLTNQLTKAEMKLDDEMQALLLLNSLYESLGHIGSYLSNAALGGKLTMETVTDSLLNEETKRKERVFRCNLKPMSLRIVAEMRSVEETMDEEGLWEDPNLAPN